MATKAAVMPVGPSMLLAFRARNVLSFRDEVELSLRATTLADDDVVRAVPWRASGATVDVLPVVGVFGANASGKSNLLRAMSDMASIVVQSFAKWMPDDRPVRYPFQLAEAPDETSSYEVELVLDGIEHEYGFELDDERIVSEWAYQYPYGRRRLLFRREAEDVSFGDAQGLPRRAISSLLRSNALVLSTAAQLGAPSLTPLFQWFRRNLKHAAESNRVHRQVYTAELLRSARLGEAIRLLLSAADLGIEDIEIAELDSDVAERVRRFLAVLNEGLEADIDEFDITPPLRLKHRAASTSVYFEQDQESLGTLVWLGLIGPVLDALESGSVLLADELDGSLHPTLVAQLVSLFQDHRTNPRRAQLIFNAHDTSLLGDGARRRLGRDQVRFTEKDNAGCSRLYSLADYSPRKDEAIARGYFSGRYGGIPLLADADFAAIADAMREPSLR